MPRFLTSQFTDELDNPEITIATLLSLEFESSEIFLWSGIGNVTYDGDLYLGNGWLQGHSPVSENGEAVPQGVSIVLTGIPQSLLSLVLSQTSQRKIGTLMLGALDDNFALIPDPTILYKGQIEVRLLIGLSLLFKKSRTSLLKAFVNLPRLFLICSSTLSKKGFSVPVPTMIILSSYVVAYYDFSYDFSSGPIYHQIFELVQREPCPDLPGITLSDLHLCNEGSWVYPYQGKHFQVQF